MGKKQCCAVCTRTTYACGGPLKIDGRLPKGPVHVLAIQPIKILRGLLYVTKVLNMTRHHDPTTAPLNRPRKLIHEDRLLPELKYIFELAKDFQKHLMELDAGFREVHVRANHHTKEMLEAARFLDGKGERRVGDNTAREVLAILLSDEWGDRPAGARYVSPGWIKDRL